MPRLSIPETKLRDITKFDAQPCEDTATMDAHRRSRRRAGSYELGKAGIRPLYDWFHGDV